MVSDHVGKPLNANVRQAREAAGLTQGQAAKILNLHRPTLSEIEAGRRRVSSDELERFSKLYGVSVNWLLGQDLETGGAREDLIRMAARELASLKREDLDRLITVIRSLRAEPEA